MKLEIFPIFWFPLLTMRVVPIGLPQCAGGPSGILVRKLTSIKSIPNLKIDWFSFMCNTLDPENTFRQEAFDGFYPIVIRSLQKTPGTLPRDQIINRNSNLDLISPLIKRVDVWPFVLLWGHQIKLEMLASEEVALFSLKSRSEFSPRHFGDVEEF